MYDAHASPVLDIRPGLSVRPDVLWIPIVARVKGSTSVDAVAGLQTLAATVATRFVALHAGVTLQPGRLVLEPDEKAGSKTEETRLDGRLVLPLDLDADYWQRARLAAGANELLRDLGREAGKRGLRIELSWRSGTPRLADADALYPVLAAVWKSRVAMLEESSASAAWNAPVQIDQTPISLEEVKLTLVPSSGAHA